MADQDDSVRLLRRVLAHAVNDPWGGVTPAEVREVLEILSDGVEQHCPKCDDSPDDCGCPYSFLGVAANIIARLEQRSVT